LSPGVPASPGAPTQTLVPLSLPPLLEPLPEPLLLDPLPLLLEPLPLLLDPLPLLLDPLPLLLDPLPLLLLPLPPSAWWTPLLDPLLPPSPKSVLAVFEQPLPYKAAGKATAPNIANTCFRFTASSRVQQLRPQSGCERGRSCTSGLREGQCDGSLKFLGWRSLRLG
jgi:hypothetical protein